MQGNRRPSRPSSVWRLFTVIGAVTVAALGFGPLSGQADTTNESPLNAAAIISGDQLVLSVPVRGPASGVLKVELRDSQGDGIAGTEHPIQQKAALFSHRIAFEKPGGSMEKLSIHYRLGSKEWTAPLTRLLLVKGHETSLITGQEFFAGSTGSIRVDVHGVKSITDNVPLPGADVTVALKGPDGAATSLLHEQTDADGLVLGQFHVPSLPAGNYTMQVTTRSALGHETLQRQVKIKNDARILLVSDKPIYQPGQVMHLRALALQSFDLAPMRERPLTFEIEDGKGNKVFKRTMQTSAYGVTAVDFQLADEVNMGDYHIRAILGPQQAEKTVTVKKYVLPKFKVEVKADKRFYMPKEVIHADLQSDYFFGKPVAGAKVLVKASTFDVQFRDFMTWQGTTDAAGHAKFDVALPDYFVGQPLDKGNALVRLEVKLTDAADHSETVNQTYPVSNQSIRVSLLPEGGRLVPEMDNRLFAVAAYPDGSPAACDVQVWTGRQAKGKPFAQVRTGSNGLAEVHVRPRAKDFRQGPWGQQQVEMAGGQNQLTWAPKMVMDLSVVAKDRKGNTAQNIAELTSEPFGENVLLRLNKAIYKGGEPLNVDIRSSAGLPTVYLDIVRGGQTVLTKWLDVKNGAASDKVSLPAQAFGSLEIHAYQLLAGGEMIRDSRVVYVQPAADLKIKVEADHPVYQPGATGKISFTVTDADGKPTAAALGVLIVDEAVYALQEMQPGLEKVYFTLQEQLLKPQAEAILQPGVRLPPLIRRPVLAAPQQVVAAALFSGIRPPLPARWDVSPAIQRQQQVQAQVPQIGMILFNYFSSGHTVMHRDRATGQWVFNERLLEDMVRDHFLGPQMLKDPLDQTWTLAKLQKLEKHFVPSELAKAVTLNHMQSLQWAVVNYANSHRAEWFKDGEWTFPKTMLHDAITNLRWYQVSFLKDAWGHDIELVHRAKKWKHPNGWDQFAHYELVSAGPDGKLGTADDIKQSQPDFVTSNGYWWNHSRQGQARELFDRAEGLRRRGFGVWNGVALGAVPGPMGGFGGGARRFAGPGGFAGGAPMAPMAAGLPMMMEKRKGAAGQSDKNRPGQSASASAPPRVREFFPETMLWEPALITDEHGRAELPVNFADSITTWRLTASASSQGGLLGGASTPLRVFQDFFVDLDLPITLTQNDEVAFPVAIYNYLPEKQTVTLKLQREPWFELIDQAGAKRTLDLKPNEVTSVKFRVKVSKIGFHTLTVQAIGSKLSDAIKRSIEVVPDGQKVEQVITDRLGGMVKQTIDIPEDALPDASKLIVKIYPGVMSQVLEGAEGLIRLPGG